jgi:ubiquinol-cytochrome c reductase iron-sulfur subunit/rieske iron-sulfur protein
MVNRRTVVGGLAGVSVLGAAPGAFAQDDPATMPPQPGDFIVFTSADGFKPIAPEDVELGGRPVRAWPADPVTQAPRDGTLYNLLVLSRWEESDLAPDAIPYAADGVVAQTAICTHTACEVADWVAEERVMECPCHFSRFDPKNNGAVVQGPAFRRLPSLPLTVADGKVVVAEVFDSRVGADSNE